MRVARWLLALAVVVSLPLGNVHAQTEPELPQRQFEEARRQFYNGDYAMALQTFQLAWAQSKSPNARLYIGRCLHKLGKLRAAYRELTGTLRDATDKGVEDPRYIETRNAAAAELALVEPRLGKLVVALAEPVDSVRITLDGEPLAASQLGDIIAVFPGTVRVVARAPGMKLLVRETPIPAGKTVVVALRLVPEVVTTPARPIYRERHLSALQIAGVSTASTGLVALILAAASGAAAASRFSTLKQLCGDEACTDPALADVIDSGKKFETLAYVGLGVGSALLLGGGAMIVFGGDDEQATAMPVHGGGMLGFRRRF